MIRAVEDACAAICGAPERWRQDEPDVDCLVYAGDRGLEMDFDMARGADLRRLRLNISGAQSLMVSRGGRSADCRARGGNSAAQSGNLSDEGGATRVVWQADMSWLQATKFVSGGRV